MSVIGLTSCKSDKCNDNPFFSDYGTYLEAPAFDKIKNEHYMPAFIEGMKQQKAEIEAICNNKETPNFENTILAMDKSGELLNKVSGVFFNMMECMNSDEMQQIAEEVMPYYPVTLPPSQRNRTYLIEEAVIRKLGSRDPEKDEPGSIDISFSVLPDAWTPEYTVTENT